MSCDRDESGGRVVEQVVGQVEQAAVEHQGRQRPLEEQRDDERIAPGRQPEPGVEDAEDPDQDRSKGQPRTHPSAEQAMTDATWMIKATSSAG